ncbi:unnamed protein product [Cylindrotheca closterium]|uniref:PDZ domain-containing protein n=1 Tax=Cylindrotheca closterium TaxID=2856 RepID=A0AAD2CWS1_9STRA|nr:unnamed protein product [Cylindrotheca closterium]
MSNESKTGGNLLGKILLPGYTDAGSDASFKPVQVTSVASASAQPDDDDDMMSEAATEIFDNRSNSQNPRLPRREQPKEMQPKKQQQDIPHPSPRRGGENNYAFFPSTKPMPSPRPHSPPSVTRRQVSGSSVAGTSTVPETGAFSGEELERRERIHNSMKMGRVSFETGGQVVTLSAKALQAMDEKQTTSSSEDASWEAKQRTSLIENDDANSCVSSTASEMGTVINIGSDRFAEIEAMADMVEANADVFEMQEKQMQQEYMRRPGEKEILSLPILEGRSFEEPALRPMQSKSFSEAERGQDLGLRMKTTANDNVTTTPSINHQNHTNNPTTSAMVSAAIRRIGTGMSGKSMSGKSMSAPSTPKGSGMLPKVEDLLKSTLTPGRSTRESSFKTSSASQGLLRSPGGNSMFAERPVSLTPRFNRTPRNEQDPHLRKPPISPSIMLPGLQFARKCFSHDTTFDEYPFPVAEDGDDPESFGFDVPRSRGDRYNLRYRPLQQSQSWDVAHGKHQEAAFRARHHAFGTFKRTASHDDHSELRQRLNSDNFSPRKFSRTPAIELQTSQRIETEREDALDILACLVERAVEQEEERSDSSSNDQDTAIAKLSEALKVAKKGSMKSEGAKDDGESKIDEETKTCEEGMSIQPNVLDFLLKSHSYASEMMQATKSASSWLHSIGRGTSHPAVIMESKEEDGETTSGEEKSEEDESSVNEGSLRLQISTIKAMLHSAKAELKAKSETNEKLDAELSKCRAEIGRLKTASRSEPLHLTANKSILDISGNDDTGTNETPSASPEKKGKPEATLEKLDESKILDDSFNPDNSVMHGTLLQGKAFNESVIDMDQLNSAAMSEALNQANETIRRLHSELKEAKKIDDEKDPPTVTFPENTGSKLPEEKKSASDSMSSDLQTINVRMLDGENFVTEWTDLTPPLPPPPDHGLRSPIVNVVLEQWTTDRGLHDSLLAWIDRVMTGIDLESSVPPLTISSLDHQVRDGFVMHVLPLLLRRADIHVDVQTRAHRRTSYDMSVTVTQKGPQEQIDFQYPKPTHALLDQQHHVDEWAENFDPQIDNKSVAHSAVTEHMSNSNSNLYYSGTYKTSHPTIAEYSSLAEMVPLSESQEMDQSAKPEAGIMSALGGALGGFLSRRKGNSSGSPSLDGEASIQRAASFEEAEEPYHRVVSAPPGRIGVTFVEYRGHAMVSDVSPDSPLSSWIYPSDILIAIDDTPVSGMRVRDIVKVLTNRRDQQRALRVISSHAMNEFTMNQSAMNTEPT